MSITKNNLSDLVRDIIGGGDTALEGKYHPTIIWKLADTIIGGLITRAMYKNQESNGYDIQGEFITTFKNVSVLKDEDTDEMYSELPAPLISLKKDRGLHRVSEMKNKENAFAKALNGSDDVFSILDVHYLINKTEYRLEGNRIYYRNLGTSVKKVLIKMVAGISELDADAPIPIPLSLEDEFLSRILEYLKEEKMTPQNKYNDSNPNIIG